VRSVLDVGCGEGHAAKYFQNGGCRVHGLDGFAQAIADSVIPDDVELHDFCDGPWVCADRVDLVWSCELLEHIEEKFLNNVLATFRSSRQFLFVTHAFPGQPGHHHVNCQSTAYWIEVLEQSGFICEVDLTLKARQVTLSDLSAYPNHFARSGLVFRRRQPVVVPDSWETKKRSPIEMGNSPGFDAILKSFLIRGFSKVNRRYKGFPS
jgi:SAM-dependent methyltransferase